MDGPGFGGMNRIGGGMYKYLFLHVLIAILKKLETENFRKKSHGLLLAHVLNAVGKT